MDPLVGVLAVIALAGIVLALRHLALRASPGGFECALRVVEGDAPGLRRRFRHGYAAPHPTLGLVWRPLSRIGRPVTLPAARIDFDAPCAVGGGARLLSVPPGWVVLPVTAADGVRLQLALHRRALRRAVAAAGAGIR